MQVSYTSPISMQSCMDEETKLLFKSARVRIEFTKDGWRQLAKINRSFGGNFIRAFILKNEIAVYIAAHAQTGRRFGDVLSLRYDEHISVLLENRNGVWYITDVIVTDAGEGYAPLYFWTRIKRGCDIVCARILIGWRRLFEGKAGSTVGYLLQN